MREYQADLHIHTSEDPYDMIGWGARRVIGTGAKKGFQVLAVTNHMSVYWSEDLAEYAASKNILLIPGCESHIGGRHILLLNPTPKAASCRTFDELRKEKREDHPMAVIAPHPFFPAPASLRGWLYANPDVFDAIEWCSYYFSWANFNLLAQRASRILGLPMIGASDSHFPDQFGMTYSLIDAEPTVESVIDAIRGGRCRVVTKPFKLNKFTIHLGMRGIGIPEKWLWQKDGTFYDY